MKRMQLLAITLCLTFTVASAPANAETPLLVYPFTGNPHPTPGHYNGLLVEGLLSFADRKNRPFLEQLQARLDETPIEERFQDAFGCMFSGEADGCQSVRIVTEPFFGRNGTNKELVDALAASESGSVWVLSTIEQFYATGYNFSVAAAEIVQGPDGPEERRQLNGNYMHFFSKAADAHARGLDRSDRKARPRIGGKEARDAYWFSGNPPLIETLIAEGPSGAAKAVVELLDLAAGDLGTYKETIAEFEKFRALKSRGEASCKSSYCSMRVLGESAERIKLADTNGKRPWMITVNRWGLD